MFCFFPWHRDVLIGWFFLGDMNSRFLLNSSLKSSKIMLVLAMGPISSITEALFGSCGERSCWWRMQTLRLATWYYENVFSSLALQNYLHCRYFVLCPMTSERWRLLERRRRRWHVLIGSWYIWTTSYINHPKVSKHVSKREYEYLECLMFVQAADQTMAIYQSRVPTLDLGTLRGRISWWHPNI